MSQLSENIPKRKRSLHIKDTRIAGLYDLEKTIGQGHFAVVKLAKHVFTGEMVAVKIIDKLNLDNISKTHMMQEVRCMKLVQHPNIVRLYEVIDTQTKLFLILELGDYDMHDFIIKYEKGCPEPLAQQYFSQIIKAINYCHKLHVVHRDLKPENVVFFEKMGMVKLTDFGFSNRYEPGEQLKTSCGSLAYSAPEILLGDAYDAPAVDVWSLGVILYMLACGRLPFNEANDSETLTKILDCRYTLPDGLSQACRNLIARMLVREPPKRALLSELVTAQWVVAGDRGHAEAIPLIERHHLPESAHSTIVEQMVAGGIGSEEAILSALENDEYNYMSATYFLLAERVLSNCREERARELAEFEAENSIPDEEPSENAESHTGSVAPQSAGVSSKCRSRSNSWRANRRPCSILKEESEEELSSYLRSSRHSSRFFGTAKVTRSGASSRVVSPVVFGGDLAVGTLISASLPVNQPYSFDDLRPIVEASTRPFRGKFVRTVSEPGTESSSAPATVDAPSTYQRLTRRNSSPSVSMFSGRDRISPQAVQDLLELSKYAGQRRAASPDSVRSSRSPSPPCSSSGRTSPSMSTLSITRLKSAGAVIGGMRKLSSSPHLLGICEEGEEADAAGTNQGQGHSSLLNTTSEGISRANRSASTGVVVVGRHPLPLSVSKSSGPQATYSSVRMIRPRQAVVSPDLCRRYEQHQRFVAKSRRSTSCSSSEASDDEERNRLILCGSRCAKINERRSSHDKDDDNPPAGATGNGSSAAGSANGKNGSSIVSSAAGNSSTSYGADSSRSVAKETSASPAVNQLHPIPELTHLDSDEVVTNKCYPTFSALARVHRQRFVAETHATTQLRNHSSDQTSLWDTSIKNHCSLQRTRSFETITKDAVVSREEQCSDGIRSSASSLDMLTSEATPIQNATASSTPLHFSSDSGCSDDAFFGMHSRPSIISDVKALSQQKELPLSRKRQRYRKKEPLRKLDSLSDPELHQVAGATLAQQSNYNSKVDAWLRTAEFEVVS